MTSNLSRKDAEALYQLFNEFALADQRRYYRQSIEKSRIAAKQVNFIRALLAFITGLASSIAGLLVATGSTADPAIIVGVLIVAVVAPILGGAFGTLADLYQWDRLTNTYDTALKNIEVADALSPDQDDTDEMYNLALRAFAEGTLSVMTDETAQWGNLIRTPKQIEEYVEEQRQRALIASQTQFSRASTTLNTTTTPPTPLTTPRTPTDPPSPGGVG